MNCSCSCSKPMPMPNGLQCAKCGHGLRAEFISPFAPGLDELVAEADKLRDEIAKSKATMPTGCIDVEAGVSWESVKASLLAEAVAGQRFSSAKVFKVHDANGQSIEATSGMYPKVLGRMIDVSRGPARELLVLEGEFMSEADIELGSEVSVTTLANWSELCICSFKARILEVWPPEPDGVIQRYRYTSNGVITRH